MKTLLTIAALFLVLTVPVSAQSKYGLSNSSLDQQAEVRLLASKTICSSGDTAITFSKKNPPSQTEERLYWQDINAASAIAVLDYRTVYDCSKADLILRINLDVALVGYYQVTLTVTDADSGDAVFTESRSVQDKRNDLIRAAKHFREAVATARRSVQERREAAEEAVRAQAQKQRDECDGLANGVRNRIALQPTDSSLLQALVLDVQTYNRTCPNDPINPETVAKLEKASKDAQEKATRLESLRQKRAERFAKVKADAFAAYTHVIAESPFVSPTEGWTSVAGLGTSNWYIIVPGVGKNDCRFEQGPALNCLNGSGHNNYISVLNNGRYYLLKGRYFHRTDQQFATTLKDGGLTVCLRGTGCYQVLAEVRQVPTDLPEKYSVPTPSTETTLYENNEFWLHYPQNWHADEKKSKEGKITQVNFGDPAAHLGEWYTHGVFIGHVASMAKGYPATLDGAYAQFTTVLNQNSGLTVTDSTKFDLTIGGLPARLVVYSQPSIFTAPESGYIIVVKDKGEGFFYIEMFLPSNEYGQPYQQTFTAFYKSIQFK